GWATGFTKSFAAKETTKVAMAHETRRIRAGYDVGTGCMSPIIEGNAIMVRGRSLFRMAQLDHRLLWLPLQRGAGRGDVCEPALLALPDGAPWQIPQGICRKAGTRAGAAPIAGNTGACDLGPRRFRRRGTGGCWVGERTSAALAS